MTSAAPRFRLLVGASVLLFAFLLLSSAHAQEKEKEPEPQNVIVVTPNGTEFFRDILLRGGFQPLEGPNRLNEQPDKTVLVIFGSTRLIDIQFEPVRQFLEFGGKILICSDRRSDEGLRNLLNLEIIGTKLRAGNANEGYLDDPDLPYLKPYFNTEWRRDPQSPSKAFVDGAFLPGEMEGRVASNYPSSIRFGAPFGNIVHTTEALAGYPKGTRFRTQRIEFDPDQDFAAVGGRYGRGNYLVLGDQDLFSNIMMVQPIQNQEFATSVVSWLREGVREPRTRCLFIEDNQIQTRFDTISPGEVPWHVYVNYVLDQHANNLLYKLDEKDVFNKAILGQNYERFRPILRAILFGLLIAVILYGFRWMWGRRHRIDYTINEASNVIARIPQGGALQQRHEALMESGNLFEAFRSRIRERFQMIGGGPDSEGKPPRIEVEESIDDPRSVRKRVLDLWDVAYGNKTIPVKATDWDAANNRLRKVLQESLDGRWRFEPPATTT